MSKDKNVELSFDQKIEQAIRDRVDSEKVFQIMVVDYIKELCGASKVGKLTDGETTVQFIIHNPAKEQPKRKK